VQKRGRILDGKKTDHTEVLGQESNTVQPPQCLRERKTKNKKCAAPRVGSKKGGDPLYIISKRGGETLRPKGERLEKRKKSRSYQDDRKLAGIVSEAHPVPGEGGTI